MGVQFYAKTQTKQCPKALNYSACLFSILLTTINSFIPLHEKRPSTAKPAIPNHHFFQKWVSYPDFDSYWTSILPNKEDYATLDIPILSITGYYDGDQLGAFYYNNHLKYGGKSATDKHYLLIGPYDHGGSLWHPSPIQNGISIGKEALIPISSTLS